VISVRPRFAELTFQLFERAVHPELFEIHLSRSFVRGKYSVRFDITSSGHITTFSCGQTTLTEVVTSAQAMLPQSRKLFARRLSGKQVEKTESTAGLQYESTFSLEPSNIELFWAFQQQLKQSDQPQGIVKIFDSSGRMAMGAMSYIYPQLRDQTLRVQAFHTFPDDCAIVKSESIFRIPADSLHSQS
jgi:hypothetical protein